MIENEGDWLRAIEKTWVVRFPRQSLATFGVTNIRYFVVTEPIYQPMTPDQREGVVRTGQVVAEKPAVVTPFYAMNLEGFSDEAYEYRAIASKLIGRKLRRNQPFCTSSRLRYPLKYTFKALPNLQ